MSEQSFQAYRVDRTDAGEVAGRVVSMVCDDLPEGELDLRIEYSSLNYKDALSATGHPGISPNLPHVPGIDAIGIVETSSDSSFEPGQRVNIQSPEFGSTKWGGWTERCRVPAAWAAALPGDETALEVISHGTAGFTAAQCVHALIDHDVLPDSGPIAVTGATGGVSTIAIALLAQLDYQVTAFTGKLELADKLRAIGASDVQHRSQLADESGRPMLSRKWAGGIDTVGGSPLTSLLRQLREQGCVAACGLAADDKLEMTVYPFILRGAKLIGIDSANCTKQLKRDIWKKLTSEWRVEQLPQLVQHVRLDQIGERVSQMLAGNIFGRTVIDIG